MTCDTRGVTGNVMPSPFCSVDVFILGVYHGGSSSYSEDVVGLLI